MLEVKKITAGYERRNVLHDVSAKIDQGKITVIMGPNGAGKSTLLKTMFGTLRIKSGHFELDGHLYHPKPSDLVTKGIFMIPQGMRVFSEMTVLENLELATHFWEKRDNAKFKKQLDKVLKHFSEIKPKLNELAGNLSGGQQQMVAMARGLINEPKLLFLDEPSIGLSPKWIKSIFEKIHEIKEETGTGFVIVEHNLKTLLPLTDHAYILDQGRIIYDGPTDSKTLEKMTTQIFK